MNKLILLGIFFVLTIHLSSAVIFTLPGGIQGQCMQVQQTCDDGNCSYINVSKVVYPNQTYLILNGQMQGQTPFDYNYTFCDTSQIGTYLFTTPAMMDGIITSPSVSIPVTHNGYQLTTAQAISAFSYLLLFLFLTGFFSFVGFKLVYAKDIWIMGIFMLFMSTLLVTYDVSLAIQYSQSYINLGDNLISQTIFYIFLALLVLGLLVVVTLLFQRWKEVIRYFKREMQAKAEEDEDFSFEIDF